MTSADHAARLVLALILALAAFGGRAWGQAPPKDLVGRLEQINAERVAAQTAFRESSRLATSDDQKLLLKAQLADSIREITRRYLSIAREVPGDPLGMYALTLAISWGSHPFVSGQGEDPPEVREALTLLRRDWLESPKIASRCEIFIPPQLPEGETVLREILAKNPDRTVQGHARLALAQGLDQTAEIAAAAKKDRDEAVKLAAGVEPAAVAAILNRDPAALKAERDALIQEVFDRYADVPAMPDVWPNIPIKDPLLIKYPPRLAWMAASLLGLKSFRAAGRPAPPLLGKDLDGKPLGLADLRGKVVLVAFWASDPPAASDPLPGLRALAGRLKDRPFALVAVNSDLDEAVARAAIAKADLPGVNWRDGHPRLGVIAAWFMIRRAPACFLIDKAGGLRDAPPPGEALDRAVDELLAADPLPATSDGGRP